MPGKRKDHSSMMTDAEAAPGARPELLLPQCPAPHTRQLTAWQPGPHRAATRPNSVLSNVASASTYMKEQTSSFDSAAPVSPNLLRFFRPSAMVCLEASFSFLIISLS